MQRILLIGRGLMLGVSLLLGVAQAKAQAPGYMGHRLSVQANLELIPTLVGRTVNNNKFFKSGDSGAWGLSKRYGGALNYVISRHKSITVTFDYFRTGRTAQVYASTPSIGMYAINCYTLAVGSRFYKNIAPLGGYFELAGELSRLNTKFKNYTYRQPNEPDIEPTGDRYQFTTNDLGFNLGWGYSNIINKHLVLDFGIKSHFSLAAFQHLLLDNNLLTKPNNNEIHDDYVRITKGFHSILMFRMSVGYLF